MKKHILRQKYEVEDNNGNLEKQFDYQICLQEKGIKKENILNMFNTIACGFIRLLGEEAGNYDNMGHWPEPEELDIEINENVKFDDGTPVFKI